MSETYRVLKQQCKLVLLGDQCVGKTSIITQFTYGSHEVKYQATVGVDYLSKNHRIEDDSYRLQLWDTAGQERFRCLVPTYIRGSSAAVIVYDVTNENSFLSLKYWIDNVRIERGNKAVIFIVGNKIDLREQRVVSVKEGKLKAKELKAHFFETSVKDQHTIVELFNQIVKVLPEYASESNNNHATVKLDSTKNTKHSRTNHDFLKQINCSC